MRGKEKEGEGGIKREGERSREGRRGGKKREGERGEERRMERGGVVPKLRYQLNSFQTKSQVLSSFIFPFSQPLIPCTSKIPKIGNDTKQLKLFLCRDY